MKKIDNYNDILNAVEELKNDETLNDKEKELIKELDEFIKIDKANKIAHKAIRDNKKMDLLLKDLNDILKHYIEGTRNKPAIYDNSIYLNRINNLNNLKYSIIDYIHEEYYENEGISNEIVNKCFDSISVDQLYFDETIATKRSIGINDDYLLNEELIHRLYDYLVKNNNIKELAEGTRIINDIDDTHSIIDNCLFALSHKNDLYENIDLVLEFNKISNMIEGVLSERKDYKFYGINEKNKAIDNEVSHLESSPFKNLFYKDKIKKIQEIKNKINLIIKEYEELDNKLINLRKRQGIVNLELQEKNLSDLLNKSDYEYYSGYKKYDGVKITNTIRLFTSKEDLDNYYNFVEKALASNKLLLEELKVKEEEFNNSASKETLELIENDFITSENLAKFNNTNNDVSPVIALFTLEALIKAKNTKLIDMNISEEEYNKVYSYYDNELNERTSGYSKELADVLNDYKTKKYY